MKVIRLKGGVSKDSRKDIRNNITMQSYIK